MSAPRFINIRGTSGSGKSWLVRCALRAPELYAPSLAAYVADQNLPLYYTRSRLPGVRAPRDLAVLGHYETQRGGGCDKLDKGPDLVFSLARQLLADGYDILAEGLLLSTEKNRTNALHRDGVPVHLFYITIPWEECLVGVNERRVERGFEPISLDMAKEKDIYKRWSAMRGHPAKFRFNGVNVTTGDRAAAAEWLRGLGVLP